MKSHLALTAARALALAALVAGVALAQGTFADYQRAQGLQAKARGLVVGTPGAATWIGDSGQFWYSRTVKGGSEFLMVDAAATTRRPAFDHDKLAEAINAASGGHYTGLALPFAPVQGGRGGGAAGRGAPNTPPQTAPLTFTDPQSLTFGTGGSVYTCKLADYTCTKGGAIPANAGGRGRGGAPEDLEDDDQLAAPREVGGDPVDGLEYQPPSPSPQQDDGGGRGAGRGQPACAPRAQNPAQGGRGGRGGRGAAAAPPAGQTPAETATRASFDGKWEALIENYNIFLRPTGATAQGRPLPSVPLSFDGSEGNYYTLRSVAWSPDSKHLAAYHTRPGSALNFHYVESSPADQVQPKHSSVQYRKPGDALDIAYPALFDVEKKTEVEIDQALFPNPYDITPPIWCKDSRAFTFEYNQRGHQVYRVLEVDANRSEEHT